MKFLVAIHYSNGYDGSQEIEQMGIDIAALNEEMVAARVWLFAGGLHSAGSAKSLRSQPGGKVLVTEGPYLETKAQVSGLWVLECAGMDESLEWGRKAVVACRALVEVRQFL